MSEPLPKSDPSTAPVEAGPAYLGTPLPPAEPYRPISGWAIAGFGAGALFAAFTVITTAIALWQGVPFFLHPSIIFVAIAGGVLSFLGQRHVQNSEGTRAGAKLASLGLWLSLISGLSYLSYYFFTGGALHSQAHAFLMEKSDEDSGFFPRMREGAADPVLMNQAFLLTRAPRQREGARPEDELEMMSRFDVPKDGMPGDLSVFRYGLSPQAFHSALPRLFFKKNAKDVKIIEQGVQEWKYEQKSYMVYRKYRIETKELEWDTTLCICSSEAEAAGQGRKWFLNLGLSGITSGKLTTFGLGLKFLRGYARADLEQRIFQLNRGEPLKDLKILDRTEWDARFGRDPQAKRAVVYSLLEDKSEKRIEGFLSFTKGDEVGMFEEVGSKIRIYQAFRFSIPKSMAPPSGYFVDVQSVHESIRDVDPVQIASQPDNPGWNLLQFAVIGMTPMPSPELKGKGP